MCTTIGVRVISRKGDSGEVRLPNGSRQSISFLLVPGAKVRDYVTVRQGYAWSLIEPDGVRVMLQTLRIIRKAFRENARQERVFAI